MPRKSSRALEARQLIRQRVAEQAQLAAAYFRADDARAAAAARLADTTVLRGKALAALAERAGIASAAELTGVSEREVRAVCKLAADETPEPGRSEPAGPAGEPGPEAAAETADLVGSRGVWAAQPGSAR